MTDSQNDIGAPRPAGEWVTTKLSPPPLMREDVFNEVIYALGSLLSAVQATQSENYNGVKLALEYVKGMVDQEA